MEPGRFAGGIAQTSTPPRGQPRERWPHRPYLTLSTMNAVPSLTVTRTVPLSANALYRAWTSGWDVWFAEPDSIRMNAAEGAPFYFEVAQRFEDGRPTKRHPHYGRYLRLVPGSLVSLTWVTGPSGTAGAETAVTVRFEERGGETEVTLTHEGFVSEEARDRHAAAWPMVLAHQEARLLAGGMAAAASNGGGPATDAEAAPPARSAPDATLIPVRSYPDLDAAVSWLREALACREWSRVPGQRVQLTIGNGAMVVVAWDAAAAPASGGRPPATLMVRVKDIDTTYARAIALGATGVTPPADHPYGERQAVLRDPAGHSWTLTQAIGDVDPMRA